MNAAARTTAILGFGRFGRALGELVLDAGGRVRALDPHAEVPAPIRAGSFAELVADASEVVLAVPVGAIADATRALLPHLAPTQLVVDVASVKHGPVRDLTAILGSEIPWVATHPLFGPTSIALGERPLVTVVCPNPLHPEASTRARAFFTALGCEVLEQEAAEHDRVMAATHALAFFIAKGLIDIRAGEDAAFVPPSFRAMARTIESVRADASHLFATIQTENPYAAQARARLLAALESIDRDLAASPSAPNSHASRLEIPPLPERAPDLRETRDLIDDLDRDLVQLLARRAQLARRAGRAKASQGKPVVDPDRERQVFEARRRWAEGEGLDAEGVAEIFESIVRFSRATQKEPER
jgi:prephenate dehydrogenase